MNNYDNTVIGWGNGNDDRRVRSKNRQDSYCVPYHTEHNTPHKVHSTT